MPRNCCNATDSSSSLAGRSYLFRKARVASSMLQQQGRLSAAGSHYFHLRLSLLRSYSFIYRPSVSYTGRQSTRCVIHTRATAMMVTYVLGHQLWNSRGRSGCWREGRRTHSAMASIRLTLATNSQGCGNSLLNSVSECYSRCQSQSVATLASQWRLTDSRTHGAR